MCTASAARAARAVSYTHLDVYKRQAEPAPTEDQEPAIAPAPVDDSPMPEGMVPVEETFYGQGSGNGYVQSGAGSIRNCTELSAQEIQAEMMQPLPFSCLLYTSRCV